MEVGRIIRGRMEKALPLPFGQCETLRFVGEAKEPSMQELARHFKIAAPSATSLVNELVRGGYVARSGNTRDRREVRLSLTRKGKQTLVSVVERRKKVLGTLLVSLAVRDHRDLNRILNKILTDA